jgi:hypothetical protein
MHIFVEGLLGMCLGLRFPRRWLGVCSFYDTRELSLYDPLNVDKRGSLVSGTD